MNRLRILTALTAVLYVLALLGLAVQPAHAFPNGHAPPRALAPIFMPYNVAYLKRDAAASWNTMRICAVRSGVDLYPTPSGTHPARTAYRSYFQQVVLYQLYRAGRGNLAAYPGTSNHGLGLAIDLATIRMRTWIDNHGGRFGWSKKWSDAPSEYWHLRYRAGVWQRRPNPGTSLRFPQLRKGSGGKCQADGVREVQRRLGLRQDGEFGTSTAQHVKRFQRHHKLHANGVVASDTWLKLRAASRKIPEHSAAIVGPVHSAGARPLAGQDVKAVQGLLNARLVELHRRQYRVKVTGVLDHATVVAIKRFQILSHLKVTGKADARTYQALLKAKAKPSAKRVVSAATVSLVAGFEGERRCPYRDAVGIPTQGFGHTHGVRIGGRCWSHAKAVKVLHADLDLFSKGVTVLVRSKVTTPQFGAVVSFSFNVGLGALHSSTLLRKLNARLYRAAAPEFLKWDRAGGRVLLGLHRRRVAEEHLYLTGTR